MHRVVIYFLLLLFIQPSFGQDESVLFKDITVSIGAGKNRFFEEREFSIAAPLVAPVMVNFGLNKKLELGAEFSPIFFNDRSAYDFEGLDSLKNHFGGYMLSYNGNLQYSLINTYRMSGYAQLKGGYTTLHKKQHIVGELNELIGSGYNYSFGGGLRYQLGNEYDDVFPWYFDFSLIYTRFDIKIDDYLVDGEKQPLTSSSWDPLKFGSIDVILRFGYRFRSK